MNPQPQIQRSAAPAVYGWCLLCGCSNPHEPMVHFYESDGTATRLCCVDIVACTARQDTEAAWAEQRFSITDSGRQALAAIEQAQQLSLVVAS